jgi:ADP-heptose:LPS heptosyltransferase
MRVSTMRAVDRGLGRPLCAVATLLRRLLQGRRPPPPREVRRVLFVKLSEMGALVLAAPAAAEARRVFPDAEPWLLCFDDNREVAVLTGGFAEERVIAVRSAGLVGTLLGLLGAVRRVRRLRCDVVVDLEYFSRVSALLTFLSGAPVRSGFHRFEAEGLYCGDLYTHRCTWNPYLHVAQLYVVLVRAAAADPRTLPLLKEPPPRLRDLEFPRFTPGDGDRAAAEGLLAAAGVPAGAPLLLVNPNASDLLPLRRWPEERFVELCRSLVARFPDAWVVLTGAPHEAPLGERIAAGAGGARCVSVIGRTDLRTLLALFCRARVLVSADSGPPHFAALTPLRVVTLFGPETPSLYGPVNGRNEAVSAGLACSPCIHAWNRRVSACDDNVCMQRIGTEEVVAAVARALGGGAAAADARGDPMAGGARTG